MKQLFLILILVSSLFAKKDSYLYEASFLMGNSENGATQNIYRSSAYQFQFQYNGLDFFIKPELSLIYSSNIPVYSGGQTRYATMMANGIYEIPYSPLLTPYIKGGIGYTNFADASGSPSNSALLDTAAGLKLHLTDWIALKFQVMFTQAADYGNIVATGGVNFAFGQKHIEPKPLAVAVPVAAAVPAVEPIKELEALKEPKPVIAKRELPPLTVSFAYSKSKLSDESQASLKEYAVELNRQENRDNNVVIIGHTDNTGTRNYNATLSLKRADAVRAALIANDVCARRIRVDGKGEISPITTNETDEGRKQNRRVTVMIQTVLQNNNSD